MTRTISRATLILVLLFGIAATVRSQEAAVATCSSGWASFAALGIRSFSCDCSANRKDDAISWTFRGEPVVTAITPQGPASGKLREGDVIVAINGLLITTRAAGEKVANLREGENVVLTIRRNGRVQEVGIETSGDCDDPDMGPPVPSRAMVPPTAPSVATPRAERPSQPRAMTTTPGVALAPLTPMAPPAPPSWFGFGISCHNCTIRPFRDGRRWEFSEYPTIYSVDPDSPADQAGLRRGDVLMKIDGLDLLEEAGARRFGGIEPGETVIWTYRRGGTTRTARLTADEPPLSSAGPDLQEMHAAIERLQSEQAQALNSEMAELRANLARTEQGAGAGNRNLQATRALVDSLRQVQGVRMQEQAQELREVLARAEQDRAMAIPPIASEEEQHLRFAGMVGNTNVEVRGLSSVDVSYDNSTGELLIRTMDSIIRVKAPTNR